MNDLLTCWMTYPLANWLTQWLTQWLTKWLTFWLTTDLLTYFFDWLTELMTDPLAIDWLINDWLTVDWQNWRTNWLADLLYWLTDSLAILLAKCLTIWLTYKWADWLTGWLTDWLADWLNYGLTDRWLTTCRPAEWLDNCFDWLYDNATAYLLTSWMIRQLSWLTVKG